MTVAVAMRWAVAHSVSNVRCIPRQLHASLLLVTHTNTEEFWILWVSSSAVAALAQDLRWSDLNGEFLEEHGALVAIESADIDNVIDDEDSQTLLVTLIHSREVLGESVSSVLFHPVADEAFTNGLRSRILPIRIDRPQHSSSPLQIIDNAAMSVFEACSKVTHFYANTARWLLGSEDTSKRPRSVQPSGGQPSNPWLVQRELVLPASRRTAPRTIPVDCTDQVFRLWLFTMGSKPCERANNWRRLFRIPEAPVDAVVVQSLSEESLARIDKDVLRTDRTEDFYHPQVEDSEDELRLPHLAILRRILIAHVASNPSIDYVQGMNDLCSPILFVLQDEGAALSAFSAVMERHALYFVEGGDHTRSQLETLLAMLKIVDPHLHDRVTFSRESRHLFICYRWLLLLFKREVGFGHFPLILETIYSAPTRSYELFIALALLELYREQLLSIAPHFDLTLQFYAEQAEKHNVEELLSRADQFHQLFTREPSLRSDPRFTNLMVPWCK